MSESVFVVEGTYSADSVILGVFESQRDAEEFALEVMLRDNLVEGPIQVGSPYGYGTNAVSVISDSDDKRVRCIVREFPFVTSMQIPLSHMTSRKATAKQLSGDR